MPEKFYSVQWFIDWFRNNAYLWWLPNTTDKFNLRVHPEINGHLLNIRRTFNHFLNNFGVATQIRTLIHFQVSVRPTYSAPLRGKGASERRYPSRTLFSGSIWQWSDCELAHPAQRWRWKSGSYLGGTSMRIDGLVKSSFIVKLICDRADFRATIHNFTTFHGGKLAFSGFANPPPWYSAPTMSLYPTRLC